MAADFSAFAVTSASTQTAKYVVAAGEEITAGMWVNTQSGEAYEAYASSTNNPVVGMAMTGGIGNNGDYVIVITAGEIDPTLDGTLDYGCVYLAEATTQMTDDADTDLAGGNYLHILGYYTSTGSFVIDITNTGKTIA